MKNTLSLFFLCLYVLCLPTSAQTVPKPLESMFPKPDSKGKRVISLASLTASERNMQMKGTKFDPHGYLTVDVTEQYVNMLSELNSVKAFKFGQTNDGAAVDGLPLLGVMNEGNYKKSFGFGEKNQVQQYVTIWNFKADGASLVIAQDFLNQKVQGMPATLSLAVAKNTQKCLWKLLVVGDDLSYDVIMEDVIVNGVPSLSPALVMAKANRLIAFAKQRF
jgi:hypothetical protein